MELGKKTLENFLRATLVAGAMLASTFAQEAIAQWKKITHNVQHSTTLTPTGLESKLYLSNGTVLKDISENGLVVFDNTSTGVEKLPQVPTGFNLSQNYPNPFNPTTYINFSVPSASKISLKIFDIAGRAVATAAEGEYSAGMYTASIELNGFANGVYFADFIAKNKDGIFRETKKMLLLYGSQHATAPSMKLEKPSMSARTASWTSTTTIDSVVVSGKIDGKEVKATTGFINVPITQDSTHLGTLVVQDFVVNGKVYLLMKWDKPDINAVANANVSFGNISTTTDANGNYSVSLPFAQKYDITITHPIAYTRETKFTVDRNLTLNLDVVDTVNFSREVMNFYNVVIINKDFRGTGIRWVTLPTFYIVADTNTTLGKKRFDFQKSKILNVLVPAYKTPYDTASFLKNVKIEAGLTPPTRYTPGFFVVRWDSVNFLPGYIAYTIIRPNFKSGTIDYAESVYHEKLSDVEMEKATIHELSTGMNLAGRSNSMPSVWNFAANDNTKNFTPNDIKMCLFLYSRSPGSMMPDKDDMDFFRDKILIGNMSTIKTRNATNTIQTAN